MKMHPKNNFYTRYILPPNPPVDVGNISMTCQEFKDESEINNLITKFYAQGFVPPPSSQAIYGDFTMDFDYMDAFNALEEANNYFNSLPSKIRDDFNNDPAKFFDVYVRDPKILEQYADIPIVQEDKVNDNPENNTNSTTAS